MKCHPHLGVALAQERLRREAEHERLRLQVVIDRVAEGMLIADVTSSRISHANAAAAELLGMPIEQLIGTPLSITLQECYELDQHYQPGSRWQFALLRALHGETVTNLAMLATRPDGSQVALLGSCAPLRNEDGFVTGGVLALQDMTAQKRLERQNQEFLAIASHELRTPVTALLGYADLLRLISAQGKTLDTEEAERVIEAMIRQGESLARLIEDLFDLTSLEQEHFALRRAPHDLRALLSHVIEGQIGMAAQRQLKLVLEERARTGPVDGHVDAARLTQVFNNLLNNAIKYSPQGGIIEVGMRAEAERPNRVLIWVKDQGVGIAESDLPYVFDRYYRARAVSSTTKGLGLGLYLVREVIHHHGGRVWAESIPGKGSTFYVELPLAVSSNMF